MIEQAEGALLVDVAGRKILDFHGNSVHQLGHGHPKVLNYMFVLAVFTVLDDVGRLAWRLFSRFVGDADEPHAPAHGAPAPVIRTRPVPDVPMAAE